MLDSSYSTNRDRAMARVPARIALPTHVRLPVAVVVCLVAGCLWLGFAVVQNLASTRRWGASLDKNSVQCSEVIVEDALEVISTKDASPEHTNKDKAQPEASAVGGPQAPEMRAARTAGRVNSIEQRQKEIPDAGDHLPNEPAWDASMWNLTEKIDPTSKRWPNTMAICALMKNEQLDDVLQWLQYHRWLGVDKVFLRENGEELPDGLLPQVQSMLDDGFLDLGTLPGPMHPLHSQWYNRCSKPDMAGSHSWVAFIDLDEFLIVLDRGLATSEPDLKGLLESSKGNAGISLQWVMFGSSGHVERPPGGPLANFHRCTGHLSFQMKCVANMYHATYRMFEGKRIHGCMYKFEGDDVQNPPVIFGDGTPVEMESNTEVINPKNDSQLGESRTYAGHLDQDNYNQTITSQHQIVLFHYVTRSLEDYTSRKILLPAGVYADTYRKYAKKAEVDASDVEVMAEFERVNGFDGGAPICSSAQKYADLL